MNRSWRRWTVLLAVVAALLLAVGALRLADQRPAAASDAFGADAERTCRGWVYDRIQWLHRSARFSHLAYDADAPNYGYFTVTGHVEAQNTDGTPVSSDFICIMAIEGSTWRLVSLDGLTLTPVAFS